MRFKFFILYIIVSFSVISCEDPAVIIRKDLNAGIEELHNGRYTKAIHHFKDVLEIDSTQSEAHHYLGLVYDNQQKYSMAMEEYNKAIHFNSKYGEAYKSRAQLWFFMGDRDKSCADYIKAEDLGVKNLSNYTRHCR